MFTLKLQFASVRILLDMFVFYLYEMHVSFYWITIIINVNDINNIFGLIKLSIQSE